MMFLTAVGFGSMFYLLRRALRFSRTTALLGAVLFSISNIYYIQITHPQLAAVVFVPLLLVLAWEYWNTRKSRRLTATIYVCTFGVLLALVLFTSFYIGWFTVLLCGTGLVFLMVSAFIADSGLWPLSQIVRDLGAQRLSVFLGISAFLVALVPFLVVYWPAFRRTGTRDLAGTLFYMPSALGVFDVGRDNFVWGRVSETLEQVISPGGLHEHPSGWPFAMVCLFLATAVYCSIRLFRPGIGRGYPEKRYLCLIFSLSLSCIILWLAGVRFGQHAPVWAVLWRWVPGAAAIRVPQRINLVLNVAVVVVCMFGFERLLQYSARYRFLGYLACVMFAFALLVEQLNFMPTHLISRAAESRKFSKIANPPRRCSEFYVSTWSDRRPDILEFQTDAILAAEQFSIPTLNGYSGWFPRNWDLLTGSKTIIAERAREWAAAYGLSNLCSLDVNSGSWSLVDLQKPPDLGQLVEGAVANPGFENSGVAPWRPFQGVVATVTSEQSRTGTHSLAETAGVGSLYQDITGLEPGATYTISAWVSGSPGATASPQIAAFSFGAAAPTFSPQPRVGPGWQLLIQPVKVGQAGVIRVHLLRGQGSGTIYWDDIQVYRDTSAK